MMCGAPRPLFRLLDAYVGWDPLASWAVEGIEGLGDPDGLRLAGTPSPVHEDDVTPWLAPPRVAYGDTSCTVFLATRHGPAPLLALDACATCFEPFGCVASSRVVALAAGGGRVAALDESGTLWLMLQSSGRLLGQVLVRGARLVALTPDGDVLVVRGEHRIERYGSDGLLRDAAARPAPGGKILRIAVAADRSVWVLVRRDHALQVLTSPQPAADPCAVAPPAAVWQVATVDALSGAFSSGIAASSGGVVCLPATSRRGPTCWDDAGCPVAGLPEPPGAPAAMRRGQLLTTALDSGIRRCEWHRVRAEALVPPGTALEIAVAAAEQVAPAGAPSPITAGDWAGFAAGVPHALDWQTQAFASGDELDFLIDRPRGRYLFVRVRMTSDGPATPLLRRVRIDMPRATSVDRLPAVYGDNPEAERFTKQFASLFDATVDGFDAAIERFPQLLDADYAPAAALPWLARLLAVEVDDAWSTEQRREVVRRALQLYRRRGTRAGMLQAIALSFPLTAASPPVIRELGLERPWASLGSGAALGSLRLFGKSRARLRLGTSTLGVTPIRSFGAPARDPVDALAARIEVSAAPYPGVSRDVFAAQLGALIESQKPAHTVASVRIGGGGFVVGVACALGVDTIAAPPPGAVLGGGAAAGTIRLGRTGTLAIGRDGGGMRLDDTAAVGIHTAAI